MITNALEIRPKRVKRSRTISRTGSFFLSLSLARVLQIAHRFSHLGSPPSPHFSPISFENQGFFFDGISPFIILRFTLCRIEPIEGRASFPEVNSKSFNFLSLFSRVSRFSTGLEFLEEFLGEPAFMTRFLYIK